MFNERAYNDILIANYVSLQYFRFCGVCKLGKNKKPKKLKSLPEMTKYKVQRSTQMKADMDKIKTLSVLHNKVQKSFFGATELRKTFGKLNRRI